MTGNQKAFFWTFLAVVAGIFLYARYKKVGTISGTITWGETVVKKAEDVFVGPDIDPMTGVYLPPGAQAGTINNQPQGAGVA